jgi:hypothetical protein
MPSSAEHRQKAERNAALARSLDVAAYPEWVAVAAFYAAVHLVERLAACGNLHHQNHPDRSWYVQRHHRAIYPAYQALFDAGHAARYATLNQFNRAYTPAAVRDVLVGTHLDAITRYVETYMQNRGSGAAGS